ncbi:MAG: peptidoglycan editing factor PgeF [Clostridia bacterium]|nr:peptidoglycan editing factor PgeF [Clostridia bacterium]
MKKRTADVGMREGYTFEQVSGIGFFRIPALVAAGIDHGLTDRNGGVSVGAYRSLNMGFADDEPREVTEENYRRMCRAIGVEYETLVIVNWEHGAKVEKVDASDAGRGFDREPLPFCDGIVTNDPSVTLITSHADCASIFVYDPATGAVGLAHAGWKGTFGRVGQHLVEMMAEHYGSRPEEMIGGIGPCICQDCFEVDEELGERFQQEFPNIKCTVPGKPGKAQLDMELCAAIQLADAGLKRENITMMGACTYEMEEHFFSHRRDRGKTGDMAGYIRAVKK